MGFTLIHLALLHKVDSSSPISSNTGVDDVPFTPLLRVKKSLRVYCLPIRFLFISILFFKCFESSR